MTDTDIHPGQWRLTRVEVVNWGTFDGHCTIDVARKGHLFTGASGSGKSSLLDAMAAVLTPDRWLRFNAAAQDASSRSDDRTLISYIRGAWSNEADEVEDRARSAYLRGRTTWSGVLLRYENLSDAPVTLARLFHLRGASVDKAALRDLCLLDRGDLTLADLQEYASSGIDVRRLKAARKDALVTSNMSHKSFYQRLCRVFGIGNTGALQLLHKTQSAKNLGSLDHLFRTFMLEEPETFARARSAVEQFGELEQAHRHVVDHRMQAEQLRALEASIRIYEDAERERVEADRLESLIGPFQDRLTLSLTESDRARQQSVVAKKTGVLEDARLRLRRAEEQWEDAQRRAIDLGGADVERVRDRLAESERDADRVGEQRRRFSALLATVEIEHVPETSTEFSELIATAEREVTEPAQSTLHEHQDNDVFFAAKRDIERIDAELDVLKRRRSNLPPALLLARQQLAEDLGLREREIPFVGELIEVRPEHADWAGAIERVLHPLAVTLAVRDEHLVAVRRWIDGRHLGARLVFEAVPAVAPGIRRASDPRSLLHRVRVTDGGFSEWVHSRLSRDYDYVCVEGSDELDAVERGVTIRGQVKKSSRRFEKDDRFRIDDRGRWVLGADNEAKVEHLLSLRRDAQQRLATSDARLKAAQSERDANVRRRGVFEQLMHHRWSEIDNESAQRRVREHRAQLTERVGENTPLNEALRLRDEADQARVEARDAASEADSAVRIASALLKELDEQIARLAVAVAATTIDEGDEAALEQRYRRGQRVLTRETINAATREVMHALHAEATRAYARQSAAESEFTEAAAAFRSKWPSAADLTAQIADRSGYLTLLERIVTRGLPEHEENFRKLLRDRSREHIGLLLSDLRDAPKQVTDRIDPVNVSLATSPFDQDRFLKIDVKVQRAPEVNDFMDDLRAITQGSWADEDLESAERRYETLARVMARLGSSENPEVLWRKRVLDTREHVGFRAKELDPAGRVVNVHESSAGLSGGQRQKLVVFCLAAALRYQLTADEDHVPSYATIILDEAFDKADSRYTRMALDVFREFGFHLLLATPQKLLQTIEPYVGAVTAIDNPTRRQSLVANLVFAEA